MAAQNSNSFKNYLCIKIYSNFLSFTFQVNMNGHVSFKTELPGYKSDLIMPVALQIPFIAPFLADADTRLSGNVYYRWVPSVYPDDF